MIFGAPTSAQPPIKLITPGNPVHSLILSRMAAAEGSSRMPPIATTESDTINMALVSDWISQSLPTRKTYEMWRSDIFGSSVTSLGAPGFDADSDGHSNYAEFLAQTAALDPSSFLVPAISITGGALRLNALIPANRSFKIEKSTDLQQWSPWDVPGNHGIAHPGGQAVISGPVNGAKEFFRYQLQER